MPEKTNAREPQPGEVWSRIGGGRSRVVTATNGRVQVVRLESGDREWIGSTEFIATHRAPLRVVARP